MRRKSAAASRLKRRNRSTWLGLRLRLGLRLGLGLGLGVGLGLGLGLGSGSGLGSGLRSGLHRIRVRVEGSRLELGSKGKLTATEQPYSRNSLPRR